MHEGSNVNTALLVQLLAQIGGLREDVGGIKQQMDHGSKRFEDIGVKQDAIVQKQQELSDKVEPLVIAVGDMAPKVKTLMTFMGRIGFILSLATTILFAVFALIAASWKFAWDALLKFVTTHFHLALVVAAGMFLFSR